MAEQGNITAMDKTHNPEPSNLDDEDKGIKTDPTKLVQAIEADREFMSSFSEAIIDYYNISGAKSAMWLVTARALSQLFSLSTNLIELLVELDKT